MTFLFLIIVIFALIFVRFIFYAKSPGVSELRWPRQGLRHWKTSTPPSPRPELKILTYNIGYASGALNNLGNVLEKNQFEKNLQTILETLRRSDADIALLQEVDFESRRSFFVNQLEFLARGSNFPFAAYAVTWNKKYVAWPYWPPSRHFRRVVSGQVILSRFPILEQSVQVFPRPEGNPFWYNWFYLDRVVQRAVVDWNGRKLALYHAHLEAFDAATRKRQLQNLAETVAQDSSELKIAGGDFNSDALVEERRDLEDFSRKSGLSATWDSPVTPTFPSWEPREAIDHVFVSENFTWKRETGLQSSEASDHIPVLVELRLLEHKIEGL